MQDKSGRTKTGELTQTSFKMQTGSVGSVDFISQYPVRIPSKETMCWFAAEFWTNGLERRILLSTYEMHIGYNESITVVNSGHEPNKRGILKERQVPQNVSIPVLHVHMFLTPMVKVGILNKQIVRVCFENQSIRVSDMIRLKATIPSRESRVSRTSANVVN